MITSGELNRLIEDDGVGQFTDAFANLLAATNHRSQGFVYAPLEVVRLTLLKELYKGKPHF